MTPQIDDGKSFVAGITNLHGDLLRVVITDGCLGCHAEMGERIVVVPDYKIQEPVPLADIPDIVAHVENYVEARKRQ